MSYAREMRERTGMSIRVLRKDYEQLRNEFASHLHRIPESAALRLMAMLTRPADDPDDELRMIGLALKHYGNGIQPVGQSFTELREGVLV